MSELSPQIVVAIGMVASVAAQLLKVYAEKKNKKLGRALVSWIVMGISFVVALFAYPVVWPALPSLADPTVFITGVAAWIQQFVVVVSALAGFAVLIYNVLLEKVFNLLGNWIEAVKTNLQA